MNDAMMRLYTHDWGDHKAVYYNDDDGTMKLTIFKDGELLIACLHDLVVYPESRKRGRGRAMLEKAINHARGNGCDSIILWNGGEPWVGEWYKRNGFVESHLFEDENGAPCLHKILKP